MYSLDINFLNDRPELGRDTGRAKATAAPMAAGDRRPLIWGAVAAVLLPALALGSLLFLQARNADLERQRAELEIKLGDLEALKGQEKSITAEVAQVKGETEGLVSVFNQVKPLSALTQVIRDRTPPGVQIVRTKEIPLSQVAALQGSPSPSPTASPAANAPPAPPPRTYFQIDGVAKSFSDVNDFLLLLQRSNLLDANQTRIVSAELVDAPSIQPLQVQGARGGSGQPPKLPKEVKFSIQSALTEVPTSELLRELDRKGAAGIVTRIEALQKKGVMQP